MSPNAATATNEATGNFRVMNFAGIRVDEIPVRMLGNVVAGSNDMGFMHRAEKCPATSILNNEAFAVIIGVFLLPQRGGCQTANLYTIWKAAHIGVFLADIKAPQTQLSKFKIADSHLGIVPYFSVGSNYRRLWIYDSVVVGSSPFSNCEASKFCRAQHIHDPFMAGCNSIYAPGGFRRIGYMAPFNTGNAKTCDVKLDPRLCRMLSPAYPQLDGCHYPFEYHNHMDKGLGWTYFTRVTFSRFKDNDCGYMSRALSMGPSGAEINFPMSFKEVQWHETDYRSRYEMSAEILDPTLVGRKSPCKLDSGGCMGLDQLLMQDDDGSLLGLPDGSPGSVIPFTPRTETVWSPMCTTDAEELWGDSGKEIFLDAMVCPNVTVQLVEMRNLDRGAADVKFGPWALTPNADEDNGFSGGVISSTGSFYAVCPCGWDFSFYHALIKPSTTYYAEVISLPENFMLRYWSPKPDDSILLQFFYPDSRGVNVFVAGSKKPDMDLKLARPPTLADKHGAHLVDAQGLRFHITLRGSQAGFDGRQDIVVRRTPTVKLKMNVEISINEFNGASFQTNMAILLGIPPERIKVVAVQVRRRLGATDDEDDDELVAGENCGWRGNVWRRCPSVKGRRLASSALALDVNIEPSQDVGAAASGGDSDASTESLNAQAAELNSVSQNLEAMASSDNLAAAAGGTVQISELQAPAEQDESLAEEKVSEEDTAPPVVVDVEELAAEQEKAAASDEPPVCPTTFGDVVTVGGVSKAVYPTAEIADGGAATMPCADVNSGFEGDIDLKCTQGILKATATKCVPKGCSGSVEVTLGTHTSTVDLPAPIASGLGTTVACSSVASSYAGDISLSCEKGTVTYDTKGCMPGCPQGSEVNVTVAGSISKWTAQTDLQSGARDSVTCQSVNTGYSGEVEISCFFGVLAVNPSTCAPRDCNPGDKVNVTVGSITSSVTLANTIRSGLAGTVPCGQVNSAFSADVVLSCVLGTLSFKADGCRRACSTSTTKNVQLGGATVALNPLVKIDDGETEYNRNCQDLHSGFEGVFSVLCTDGALFEALGGCTERGCTQTDSVSVTLNAVTKSLNPDLAMASGTTLSLMCEDVTDSYTGVIILSCARGTLTADSSDCAQRPCEPWDFYVGTVQGESGLIYPRTSLQSGQSGTAECNGANVEYSGDLQITCTAAVATVDSAAGCRLTCAANGQSIAGRSASFVLDGVTRTVSPADRIFHDATGIQACAAAAYGYSGDITLGCDNGVLSATNVACVPDPCTMKLRQNMSVLGKWGITSPKEEIASGGYGLAYCHANNEYSGFMNVSCYASVMTVVNASSCKAACTTHGSSTELTLSGQPRRVVPASMIHHGEEGVQLCSSAHGGYTGIINLTCSDGNLNVAADTCLPNPCKDGAGQFLEHGSTWTVSCQTVSTELYGNVVMSCDAGTIRSDSSGCRGPCNTSGGVDASLSEKGGASGSDAEVSNGVSKLQHDGVLERPCSAISPDYDGTMNISCNLGEVTVDTSGCVPACPTDMSQDVLVSSGNTLQVSPQTRISSGDIELGQCSTHDAGYTGSLSIACSLGTISIVQDCKQKCLKRDDAGTAVDPPPRRLSFSTTTVRLKNDLLHGGTEEHDCSGVFENHTGVVTLGCDDGTVSVVSSTCAGMPCGSQHVRISPFPEGKVIDPPGGSLGHAATDSKACSSLGNLFSGGDVALSCSYSMLSADATACKKACPIDLAGATVQGKRWTQAVSPSQEIADGADWQDSCKDLFLREMTDARARQELDNLEGSATLQCERGVVSLKQHNCGYSCPTSDQVTVDLPDAKGTVLNPTSKMNPEEERTQTCSESGATGYDGTVKLTCDDGTLVASDVKCSPKSCSSGSSTKATMCTFYEQKNWKTTNGVDALGRVFRGSLDDCKKKCCETSGCKSFAFERSGNGKGQGQAQCFFYTQRSDDPGAQGEQRAAWDTYDMTSHEATVQPKSDVSHKGEFSEPCSVFNKGIDGNFTASCRFGDLDFDVSKCEPRSCQGVETDVTLGRDSASIGGSLRLTHGEVGHVGCDTVNYRWSGNIGLRCSLGELLADTSSCVRVDQGCPARGSRGAPSTTMAIGDPDDNESLVFIVWADKNMTNGTTTLQNCSTLDYKYGGNFTLKCKNEELLEETNDCFVWPDCPTSDIYINASGHSGTLKFTDALTHLDNSTRKCSEVSSFLMGDIRLKCRESRLHVDPEDCACVPGMTLAWNSGCMSNCPASANATVVLSGRSALVNFSTAMIHAAVEQRGCATVHPWFVNDISLKCVDKELRADTSACVLGPACSVSPPASTEVVGVVKPSASFLQPLLQQPYGDKGTTTLNCSDADPLYVGYISLRCAETVLRVDTSECVLRTPCKKNQAPQLPIQAHGFEGTLELLDALESNATEERQCSEVHTNLIGVVSLQCYDGQVYPDASKCQTVCKKKQAPQLPIQAHGFEGTLELLDALESNATEERKCSEVHMNLIGVVSLQCFGGEVFPDASQCQAVCSPKQKEVPVNVLGRVEFAAPPVNILSGKALWHDCSSLRKGISGQALFSCNGGSLSVDASRCEPLPCAHNDTVQVTFPEGTVGSYSPGVNVSSGSRLRFSCAQMSKSYSGFGNWTCSEGVLSMDAAGCVCEAVGCANAPCSPTSPVAVDGVWPKAHPTPSAMQVTLAANGSTSLLCNATVDKGLLGSLGVKCVAGVVRVDGSQCEPSACTPNGLSQRIKLGGYNYDVAAPVEVKSGGTFKIPCADIDSRYLGDIAGECLNQQVILDASSCRENIQLLECPLTTSVMVGGTIRQIQLTSKLAPGQAVALPCFNVAGPYDGDVEISCLGGSLYANASACTPFAGVATETVKVIESGMTLALPPGLQSMSPVDVKDSMSTPEAKAGLGRALATSLQIKPSELIVTDVLVKQAAKRRRLQEATGVMRRLAAGLSLDVKYQVLVSGNTSSADLSKRIEATADPTSSVGQSFTQGLGTELKAAAAKTNPNSKLGQMLSSIAQGVETEGIVVEGVVTPTVSTIQVAQTTTTSTTTVSEPPVVEGEKELAVGMSSQTVFAILAAVGGVLSAGLLSLCVWKLLNRRRKRFEALLAEHNNANAVGPMQEEFSEAVQPSASESKSRWSAREADQPTGENDAIDLDQLVEETSEGNRSSRSRWNNQANVEFVLESPRHAMEGTGASSGGLYATPRRNPEMPRVPIGDDDPMDTLDGVREQVVV
eukprot:TRINITY_DN16594_c0_g2_i1.p1 TRINITY_DN16594_c0_g2~~TRINITY_DN16594_c0_g2_i1.p1  ORF type:complete len:3204 (-),score=673.13 TRINITY_DN16594_c0_g2_i1:181-9792(-)